MATCDWDFGYESHCCIRTSNITPRTNLLSKIQSGLKCNSQKDTLFFSMRSFNSGVNGLFCNITLIHSCLALSFIAAVYSLSSLRRLGILNNETLYRPLEQQPYSTQLPPGIKPAENFNVF